MHKISVIIPAHNAEKTITRALASLISNRDYIAEVIVVNDGGTDNTAFAVGEFVGHLNIVYINNKKNRGPGDARRCGIERATGEWITFVDADDCVTPSSFRYVYDYLKDSDDLVILHTQTIYYESGNFVSGNIGYSDLSCGGNFYRKSFLLDNKLVPKRYPRLCEDEFFNLVIEKYLEYKDDSHYCVWYDYPVYEVHHDLEDGKSYALSNWRDYLIKCRLESAMLLVKFYPKLKELCEDFVSTFVFSFVLLQGLMQDQDFDLTVEDYADVYDDYRAAEEFYKKHFNGNRNDIINYYNENIDTLLIGAIDTIGFNYECFISIEEFFDLLDGRVE